jgi:phosphatidylglycerophosphatase A
MTAGTNPHPDNLEMHQNEFPFDNAVPASPIPSAPVRPSARFMRAHLAHFMALGFGSGLSPVAPGTAGTLWAWLAFWALQPWMNDARWAVLLALSLPLGWWACTVTAKNMRVLDPSSIVWDEIVAFWLVLWLVTPAGFWGQLVAFALFRFFDAAKPGPVAWADQLFHGVNITTDPAAWRKAGFGIMFDDLVAALCALLVIAGWRFFQ